MNSADVSGAMDRTLRAPGRLEAYCRSMGGVEDALLAAAGSYSSGQSSFNKSMLVTMPTTRPRLVTNKR